MDTHAVPLLAQTPADASGPFRLNQNPCYATVIDWCLWSEVNNMNSVEQFLAHSLIMVLIVS